jgi:hypothetical protein
VPFRVYRTRPHNVHQRAKLTPSGSAAPPSEMLSSAHRSTATAHEAKPIWMGVADTLGEIGKQAARCEITESGATDWCPEKCGSLVLARGSPG